MNRKVMLIAAVVTIGLAGWAAYQAAAAIVRPDRDAIQSVRRMNQLPSIEHARLEKDFQSFYSKTPEEQQHLRDMHQALQGSSKPGHLRQISENFYQWYSDVRPRQRFELRDETDVDKKLELVRTIRKEMEEQQAHSEDVRARRGGFRDRKLSPQELKIVMGIIEDKLRDDDASAEKLDAIETDSGYSRYFAVMKIAVDRLNNLRGGDAQQFRRDFFADERFSEVLPDPGRPRPPRGENENSRPPQRAFLLLGMLRESLRAAYREEIAKDPPAEKELMEHFVNLPADEQEKLLWRSPDDFMRQLTKSFVHAHADKRYPKDPDDLFPDWWSRGRRDGGRRGAPDSFPGPPRKRGSRREIPRGPN